MSRARLSSAVERMRFARRMTEQHISDLAPGDWLWQPTEGVTHIAWQVGHLAFAQYALCLKRIRGPIESDVGLVSPKFLACYGRGSTPNPDPSENVDAPRIRRIFDRVFEESLAELATWDDARLGESSSPQHRYFKTKLGAVEWCSQHELTHVGQIVLLRRMMGKSPDW